ncbi:MAG TPA: hypothetical protein VGY56_07560 [Verrucomicrobiae bacterium]|nr:hypothetical protein [Verrucomicrobiae bacterium]
MFTDRQIENILMLSIAVWLGLFASAAGILIGAIIRPIRTRRFFSFLPGAFHAALPAASIAVLVSVVSAIPQILLCYDPYQTSRWDVPVWAMSAQFIAALIGSAIGAFYGQHPRRAAFGLGGIVVPMFIGGVAGAMALVPYGFDDGYESDAPVFGQAALGFVVGGFIVCMCRLATRAFRRRPVSFN